MRADLPTYLLPRAASGRADLPTYHSATNHASQTADGEAVRATYPSL